MFFLYDYFPLLYGDLRVVRQFMTFVSLVQKRLQPTCIYSFPKDPKGQSTGRRKIICLFTPGKPDSNSRIPISWIPDHYMFDCSWTGCPSSVLYPFLKEVFVFEWVQFREKDKYLRSPRSDGFRLVETCEPPELTHQSGKDRNK